MTMETEDLAQRGQGKKAALVIPDVGCGCYSNSLEPHQGHHGAPWGTMGHYGAPGPAASNVGICWISLDGLRDYGNLVFVLGHFRCIVNILGSCNFLNSKMYAKEGQRTDITCYHLLFFL